ncbi:vanadium-dependent haloperoxidase [Ulvibacterium sp.]|uniref:vanadium-dependent haloperoxidase n=1 Tax=Ulvibacterium sp. TaxID=2665914 RepID=UPI003BAB609C
MKLWINSLVIAILLTLSACGPTHDAEKLDAHFDGALMEYNRKLTDVIVADIFTPPVASRIYAYPNIAAYEGARFLESDRPSLAGQLNGLDVLPKPDSLKSYYYPLVSLIAFTNVAKYLVYDLERIEKMEKELLDGVRDVGIAKEMYDNSVAYGKNLAEKVLEWAAKDGYHRRTALPRYSVTDNPGRWRPTPPDYMEAIEPHWNTLRPFVLDSAAQFDPGLPTSFDTDEESQFYKEAKEVYETVENLDDEQLEIAKFWDCNPNISHTKGHVMYFQQQISPGGHWMHITAQVLDEQKANTVESAATLALTGIVLADAFISCWDQKYKSNLTRPETYINKYMDPDWTPILQTPAFPEHTSGHSVASTAAATMLTHIFGDNYAFADATEVPYGLPIRSYPSFMRASQEAAISRLYGGIHYKPAIELGIQQGAAVGNYVIEHINIEGSK